MMQKYKNVKYTYLMTLDYLDYQRGSGGRCCGPGSAAGFQAPASHSGYAPEFDQVSFSAHQYCRILFIPAFTVEPST